MFIHFPINCEHCRVRGALWNFKLRKHFTPIKSSNPLGAGAGIGEVFFSFLFFPSNNLSLYSSTLSPVSFSLFVPFYSSRFPLSFLFSMAFPPPPIPHSNHIHRLLGEIAKVNKKIEQNLAAFFLPLSNTRPLRRTISPLI